jgi:hypothetical protein
MKMNKPSGMKTTLALALIVPLVANGDDLFRMTWRGMSYTTGANGQIAAKPISEKDFVQQVATNNGLDPKTLVFVWRPAKRDTAVVQAKDGLFIADVIQMENNFTEITNSTETKIVRQTFLYDEAHESALGSAFGTETQKHDTSGNIMSDSFHGNFNYAIPENNIVYNGTFSTGARVKDTSGTTPGGDTNTTNTATSGQ